MARATGEHGASEKRQLIIDASIRCFAKKGFHKSRVSDIAEEAGIAYGLVYHYFENKEEILSTIFREMWEGMTHYIEVVAEREGDPRQKLHDVASFLLDSYKYRPELVKVFTLEITRNSKFLSSESLKLFEKAFHYVEEIIKQGRDDGTFGSDVDTRLTSYIFFGAIETVLNGYVLNTLKSGGRAFEMAKEVVSSIFINGLCTGGDGPWSPEK